MNNLYDKIYEAVNDGIQKALIINDMQDSDVSVNFSHKKISAAFNIMDQYVEELMNMHKYYDLQNQYYKIIKYYDDFHKKYKVKDFEELVTIFNKIRSITGCSLYWIDTSDAISLILDDDIEIPLNQFNKKWDKAVFIKIKNSVCGHDIITHKDSLICKQRLWQSREMNDKNFDTSECAYTTNDAYNDYNGYEHTYNNLNIKNTEYNDYPAFKYCIDLSDDFDGYAGYLPAMGELKLLYDSRFLLQYIKEYINGTGTDMDNSYWSSTERLDLYAWYLDTGYVCFDFYKYKKELDVFPLFKKI